MCRIRKWAGDYTSTAAWRFKNYATHTSRTQYTYILLWQNWVHNPTANKTSLNFLITHHTNFHFAICRMACNGYSCVRFFHVPLVGKAAQITRYIKSAMKHRITSKNRMITVLVKRMRTNLERGYRRRQRMRPYTKASQPSWANQRIELKGANVPMGSTSTSSQNQGPRAKDHEASTDKSVQQIHISFVFMFRRYCHFVK